MASRCRTCRHLLPKPNPVLPPLELLMALAPLMVPLMDAAGEFEGYGSGTPSEFLRWLDVDVQRAVGIEGGRRSGIPAIRGAA
jgi:hypothetical protein